MERRRRIARIVLLVTALAWVGWNYVLPDVLAYRVAARLSAACGGPVQVDAVRLGWGETSLVGVRLFEAGAGPDDGPWAAAAEVRTDVSVRSLLAGRATPREVVFEAAAVRLLLDREGRLLTRLPGGGGSALPAVRLCGQLTVRQEGRGADFEIGGVTAGVQSQGDRVMLDAAVADPAWGTWAVGGGFDRTTGAGRVVATTARAAVTPARLETLPFVPPAVWGQVRAAGETSVAVTVRAGPGEVGVRVELAPRGMAIDLPLLGLTAEDARGGVVYEDGAVSLKGVEAGVTGGRVRVDGELDFRTPVQRLTLGVTVDGAEVARLPAAWGVPARFGGRVGGRADVTVARDGGRLAIAGTGTGRATGVVLGGRPVSVGLALRDEGPTGHPCCLVAELTERDLEVARLAEELGVDLPVTVAGAFGVAARVVLPLDTLDDPRTFRLAATADLPRGTVGGVPVAAVRVRAAVADGVLRVEDTAGTVPAAVGTAAVRLRAAIDLLRTGGDPTPAAVSPRAADDWAEPRPGEVRVHAVVERLPLSVLAGGKSPGIEGTLSAAVEGRAVVANAGRLDAWAAAGRAAVADVAVGGRAELDASARLDLRRGRLSVADAVGSLHAAAAEEAVSWRVRADGPAARLATARPTCPRWRPGPAPARVALTATAAGSLNPFSAEGKITGTMTGPGASAAGHLRADWAADADRLVVKEARGELFGGDMSAEAEVPFRAAVPGRLVIRLRDVEAAPLAAVAGSPVRPPGRLTAAVRATAGSAAADGVRPLAATLGLHSPELTAAGGIEYGRGTLAYRLAGRAFGGRFQLAFPTPGDGSADGPADGMLRLDGLVVGLLGSAFGWPDAVGNLGGTADAEVRFRHAGPDRRPVGEGAVAVRDVAWAGAVVAPRVTAAVRLTPAGVEIADATAAVGGGEVSGRAAFEWGHAAAGTIDLSVAAVDPARIPLPWPAWAAVAGPIDGGVRVTPGREWRAAGRFDLPRGRVAGVEVGGWHLPVDAAYTPATGLGRIDVRESVARVALGRAVGWATYQWGPGAGVAGEVRFADVDLRHLLPPPAAGERVAGGRLSGRLAVRGADGVTASVDATLHRATAFAFPVLRQLLPFVGPAGAEDTVFDSGRCRATLSRGVVRVERLELVGPALRLEVSGTADADGHLGLDAAVHTGRLGAAVDPPVSVRLIRLRVGGTVERPSVRLAP